MTEYKDSTSRLSGFSCPEKGLDGYLETIQIVLGFSPKLRKSVGLVGRERGAGRKGLPLPPL